MINVEKMKEDLLKTEPTLYCSARAHLRGKLHMSKMHGATLQGVTGKDPWMYAHARNIPLKALIADDRRHMFHWTMDDQTKLVADVLAKYKIEERQAEVQMEAAL